MRLRTKQDIYDLAERIGETIIEQPEMLKSQKVLIKFIEFMIIFEFEADDMDFLQHEDKKYGNVDICNKAREEQNE